MDERKIRVIELLLEGYEKADIAKQIGVSRQTIYNWMDKDDWKAEFDKRLNQIKTNAAKLFDSKLDAVINEWYKMMMDDTCEKRTRAKLLVDWVDRSLGKPASHLEVADNQKKSTQVNVLKELNKLNISPEEVDQPEESLNTH